MSQENVEITERVRTFWEAFNRRDLDVLFAQLDPEMEYTPVEENVVYRGREAFTEYIARWLEAWDKCVVHPEEIEISPAEDRGFVAIRFSARGKGSEVEVDELGFWVAELRDGRMHRIKEYTRREEALEAFGLPEG
jgi:ketosteroid isomerase-like protein